MTTCEAGGPRSVWWLVGYVLTIAGGVAAAAGFFWAEGTEALALAVVLLLAAAWLFFLDRRTPRRVVGSAQGLSLVSAARVKEYPWGRVRRVRTSGGRGLPALDALLSLQDGTLVALPRKVPAGTIDRWRTELGGDGPPAGLPETWRLAEFTLNWPGILASAVLAMSVQATLQRGDVGVPGFLAVVVGVFLTLSVLSYVNPFRLHPRQVTADAAGVSFGVGGRRRVLWSDVTAVRPVDRYQDKPVLERRDGSVVSLGGPPLEVVRRWHAWSSTAEPHVGSRADSDA